MHWDKLKKEHYFADPVEHVVSSTIFPTKEIIALWFFRERSDSYSQPDLNVGGKKIRYHQNKFLLTPCKDITIEEQKKKYIRRPCIQLDISKLKYEQIVKRFK